MVAEDMPGGGLNQLNHATPKTPSNNDNSKNLIPFPPGSAKPHQYREWGRSLEVVLTFISGMSAVARNRFPKGRFKKPWSEEALAPLPPLPPNSSSREMISHRSMTDAIDATAIPSRATSAMSTARCSRCASYVVRAKWSEQ